MAGAGELVTGMALVVVVVGEAGDSSLGPADASAEEDGDDAKLVGAGSGVGVEDGCSCGCGCGSVGCWVGRFLVEEDLAGEGKERTMGTGRVDDDGVEGLNVALVIGREIGVAVNPSNPAGRLAAPVSAVEVDIPITMTELVRAGLGTATIEKETRGIGVEVASGLGVPEDVRKKLGADFMAEATTNVIDTAGVNEDATLGVKAPAAAGKVFAGDFVAGVEIAANEYEAADIADDNTLEVTAPVDVVNKLMTGAVS